MLQSYEAIYDHGIMKWLGDQPSDIKARVIVTVLADKSLQSAPQLSHLVSPRIAGKGKILGDIISPVAPEDVWNCLK